MRERVADSRLACGRRVADDGPDALLLALLRLVALPDRALGLGESALSSAVISPSSAASRPASAASCSSIPARDSAASIAATLAPAVRRARSSASCVQRHAVECSFEAGDGPGARVARRARGCRDVGRRAGRRCAATAAAFAVRDLRVGDERRAARRTSGLGMLERPAYGAGVAARERAGQGRCLVGALTVDQVEPRVVGRRSTGGCGSRTPPPPTRARRRGGPAPAARRPAPRPSSTRVVSRSSSRATAASDPASSWAAERRASSRALPGQRVPSRREERQPSCCSSRPGTRELLALRGARGGLRPPRPPARPATPPARGGRRCARRVHRPRARSPPARPPVRRPRPPAARPRPRRAPRRSCVPARRIARAPRPPSGGRRGRSSRWRGRRRGPRG